MPPATSASAIQWPSVGLRATEVTWPRLVTPLARGRRLRGGAHLVEDPTQATGAASLGHVISVARSPSLGHWIALALVSGGAARFGQRLYAVDLLRRETVAVDVVHPVFVDPEGARVHA